MTTVRINEITPLVVELAPKELRRGILYVSYKYKLALHLCCCGCGEKVVTPLSPAEWQLRLTNGIATLHPSIGNWSMKCKAHYLIRNNKVIWAGDMSNRQIAAVLRRDKAAIDAMYLANKQQRQIMGVSGKPASQPPTVAQLLVKVWNWLFGISK